MDILKFNPDLPEVIDDMARINKHCAIVFGIMNTDTNVVGLVITEGVVKYKQIKRVFRSNSEYESMVHLDIVTPDQIIPMMVSGKAAHSCQQKALRYFPDRAAAEEFCKPFIDALYTESMGIPIEAVTRNKP